jgi:protease-4
MVTSTEEKIVMNRPKPERWLLALVPLAAALPCAAQFSLPGTGKKDAAEKIACFKITALVETPQEMPPLFGSQTPQSLKEVIGRLKDARADATVKAIVLDLEEASLGFAQLEELYAAIQSFDAVDKDVYINADYLSTGTYALAAAAGEVSLVPTGDLWLMGLNSEAPYLRGLLDKIEVYPDFEHCGAYKSAAETLTQTEPSPEAREMTNWLLDGLYERLVQLIAEGRGISADRVRALIDDGPYSAEDALAAGLIDAVRHRQDFVALLKDRYGSSAKIVMDYGKKDPFGDIPENPFEFFGWIVSKLNPAQSKTSEPTVAIVYVDGPIQVGSAEVSPFGGSSGAFSTTIRKALDRAADDDSVKAVVLRVDSPGGSALASEIIWNATQRVAARKPFVVSMGNVAGSGGYYVACGASTIFADPTTITASIGVVAGKLVTTGGWNHLGITWSQYQRGKNAAMMSSSAKFSERERAKLVSYMNRVYDIFKGHVQDGRGKKLTKPLDEMAGGRVYTGAQALELGLVDKLGGLDDAIKHAAREAGISGYQIRVLPEPPNIFDIFTGKTEQDEYARVTMRPRPRLAETPAVAATLSALSRLDPQRAAAVRQAITCLELIHAETAVTMMPALVIR